jgi:hypothetical protein
MYIFRQKMLNNHQESRCYLLILELAILVVSIDQNSKIFKSEISKWLNHGRLGPQGQLTGAEQQPLGSWLLRCWPAPKASG